MYSALARKIELLALNMSDTYLNVVFCIGNKEDD